MGTRITTIAGLVLAAGLALTACTAGPVDDPTAPVTEPTETVTTDPGPTETVPPEPEPTETPGYETGAIITTEPADLPPSQKAFPLLDSTFVIVDRYEPLPVGVQDILNTEATDAISWNPNPTTPSEQNAVTDQALAFRSEVSAATGKNVIVVFRSNGGLGCNGSGPSPWLFTGEHGDCTAHPGAEEAVAAAQATVDVREDAPTWIVVVWQG